jgi:hypothetical protein
MMKSEAQRYARIRGKERGGGREGYFVPKPGAAQSDNPVDLSNETFDIALWRWWKRFSGLA